MAKIDPISANKLSEAMIYYRASHRITQAQLAKKCGVSTITINQIESKKIIPTKKVAIQIEIALKS